MTLLPVPFVPTAVALHVGSDSDSPRRKHVHSSVGSREEGISKHLVSVHHLWESPPLCDMNYAVDFLRPEGRTERQRSIAAQFRERLIPSGK